MAFCKTIETNFMASFFASSRSNRLFDWLWSKYVVVGEIDDLIGYF